MRTNINQARPVLPGWVTTRVDFWLAAGIVKDDQLPREENKLCALVVQKEWVMHEMLTLTSIGEVDRALVRAMTWEQREKVASASREHRPIDTIVSEIAAKIQMESAA